MQFFDFKWFGQIVVDTSVQGQHALICIIPRGEHQDWRVIACASQPLADVNSREVRHRPIQHNQIKLLLTQTKKSVLAVIEPFSIQMKARDITADVVVDQSLPEKLRLDTKVY